MITFIYFMVSISADAADRYWVAVNDGVDKFWHDNANWSNQSGGSGGFSVPNRASDKAIFDSNSSVNVKLGANVTKINQLKVTGTYTGTINLNGYNLGSKNNLVIYNGTISLPGNSFLQTWKDFYLYSGGTVTASGSGSKIKVRNNLHIWGTLTAPDGGYNRFILKGGFNLYNSGTFKHNNGTVTMTPRYGGTVGAAIRIDAGPGTDRNFYNLTKTGNKNVTITTNDIKIENNLTAWGVGKIRAQSNDIEIGGNLGLGNANNLVPGTGTVEFNGTSAQTIDSKANFYKLTISNSSVSLLRSANISNILRIRPGATLDINGNSLTASTLVNNGNLQLSGSETLSITTKDTDSGTITYDGTATGLKYGNTYHNLTINTSGTMTLNNDLDVNGSLTIIDGTLNAASNDINVAGNWTNNDSFISGTGKVTFDGDSLIVTGGTGSNNDFYDVTLGGTKGAQSVNAIDIDNDFEITSSGTWYTNCLGMTVGGSTTKGTGAIATTLTPSVLVFDPQNNETSVSVNSNITMTFNTAIRKTNDDAIESSDLVNDLITLKETDTNGAAIPFIASIDTTKKIITINPTSNFSSEQVIYVAISTGVENSCNTALGSVASASFTAADTQGPTHNWNITNSQTGVAIDSNITLTFNEAVRQNDNNGTALTNSIVKELITLKKNDVNGSDIPFDATIDVAKKIITINPASDFLSEQVVYAAIEASVEDSSGNPNTASSISFTAKDTITPTLEFSPLNGDINVPINAVIELTFNEAMRETNDDPITDSDLVNPLIVLKENNASGNNISFNARIDSTKKIITITPDSDFSSEQVVYVAIASVEDDADNAISASSATFTVREIGVADTTPPTITFIPNNATSGVAKDSDIELRFSEAIRNHDINNSALDNDNIDSLITLKDTNKDGATITFDATINTAKTVITINPTSDFSSEQIIYVAIGATVEDSYDNLISASSATFTAIDSIAPTLSFDPQDLENLVPVTDNITITFNEAIRNNNDTALTNSNVDALITLKDTDENGSDISFNATVDSNKKIITINPNDNFSSEQTVYVGIGATVEDDTDNVISPYFLTFTTADSTAPNLDFTPADSTTGIAVNSDITIAFDEPIRNRDNSAITNANVDSLIILKTTNSNGADIAFDAVIDNSKQLITIAPNSDFSSEQVIYVAIGATVEDNSDNIISESSITFTSADETAPTVAFVPPDASNCVPISSNISLTFSEAVRNPDDSTITDSNVGSLIALEYTSDSSPIAFTASINSDKKVITVNQDDDFVSGEVVNVSIGSVEDLSDNSMSATSGTFCVVDSTPPVVTVSPANLSTMVAPDTDIIMTFDEEIRLTDDSILNNTNVDKLITLKESNASGSDIAFNASIDTESKIITIDLVDDLSSNQIVYVGIGASVEDSYNNVITGISSTFTTGDALPPSVSIDAVITASIATNSDITFTFSEPVRNLDNSALTNANVGSLITLKDTDDTGFNIPFIATINTAKTIITIDPTSNFSSQQVVYAAIGATVEDYANNVLPASSKTFTAEYLKTELKNPFDEKDVVGLVQGQIETAKKFTQHSTTPLLKRMEWLRRHRHNKNSSRQGVKLNFVNDTMAEIANIAQLSNSINKTSNLLKNDWAIWSEGSITIGEIEATNTSSIRGIRSNGITLGIDKKINKNQMYGAAIRIEDDKTDIGITGTKLNTDKYSLSFYGTIPFKDNIYIDSAIGIGLLQTNSERIHQSGRLYGKRNGDQVFGSIVFGRETPLYDKGANDNQSTLSLYGRLDAAYTTLKSYSETGTIAALNYHDQKLKTARGSIGMLVSDEIKLHYMTFMPNARLEYGWDINNASNAVVSYIVYPNTNYTLVIEEKKKANIRLGLGVDIEVGKGLFFMVDFERNSMDRINHENTASMGLSIHPNSKSEYDLSLTKANNSLSQIDLNFNKRLNDNWSYNFGFGIIEKTNSGIDSDFKFNTRLNF